RLVDWGTRHGFLTGPVQDRRAHARALLTAAARVNELIETQDYGAALEAAFLSTADLVELTRPTPATRVEGLPERAHSALVRDRLAQELDVWTREYPVGVAAPTLDPPAFAGAIQALRTTLRTGVALRGVIAVHPDSLDRAVPLLE